MSYLPLPELSRPIGPKKGKKKKSGNLMLDYYNEIVPQTPINLIQSKPTFLPNSIGQSMNEDGVQALVNNYQAIIDKQERDLRLMISREEDLSAENLLERKRIEMRAIDPEKLSRYLIYLAIEGDLVGLEDDAIFDNNPDKLALTGDKRKDNPKAVPREKAKTDLIEFYIEHEIDFKDIENLKDYNLNDLQEFLIDVETTPTQGTHTYFIESESSDNNGNGNGNY